MRDLRVAEQLAHFGRRATRQKNTARVIVELIAAVVPVVLDQFRDGEAMAGIVNRWLKKIAPRQTAESLVQRLPTFYATRHGNGVDSVRRDAAQSETLWCPAARIDATQLARFRFPDERKQIAAYAVHHWLDDTHHRVRDRK